MLQRKVNTAGMEGEEDKVKKNDFNEAFLLVHFLFLKNIKTMFTQK